MSSKLQLDVYYLSQGCCHLVNAYEGKTQAWRKVMGAYRWGMTYSHLQADCLYTGISSGPTLANEYGRTFPFT